MKFRDRLLSLNNLIERELGRPISVKEYTLCNHELDQKNLNHVQMDFSRLHKMGLVHRHKEKVDGRRVFVYTLTSKGRRYVSWVTSNSNKKDDFDSRMERLEKMFEEWWNMYTASYRLRTGRTDQLKNCELGTLEGGRNDDFGSRMTKLLKASEEWQNMYTVSCLLRAGRIDQLRNWKLDTLEGGRKAWMPVKESTDALALQQVERRTMRILEDGGVASLTDREFNRLKIARNVLRSAGILDGNMRDNVALYFSRDSWSEI